MQKLVRWSIAAFATLGFCPATLASDFYAGKQITLLVGSGVGGGYDLYSRLLARYWPKYIPGKPTIVVQNMPAAGSLVAMNTLANSSPKDGTYLAAVQNHIGVEPVMGLTGPAENAKYDSRKLNWLGSAAKEVPLVVAWHTSGFENFTDLQQRQMLVGSPGVATSSSVFANLLNGLAGTKFKVITGYSDLSAINLALESGEIQGRTGWYVSSIMSSQRSWLEQGKIRVLVQLALEKHPAFPNVPLASEFIKDPKKREQLDFSLSWLAMGRPFVAPAGVPAERVKLLRDSFIKALADPELIAEGARMGLEVSPLTGQEVQELIGKIYDTPKTTVMKVRSLIVPK